MALGRMVERLMILDAVLANPTYTWLGTEFDKRSYFTRRLRDRVKREELPRLTLVTEDLKSGAILDTAGLKPTKDGFRVRLDGGRLMVTDGPFTETKEVIGGYALMQFASREQALDAAKTWEGDLRRGQICLRIEPVPCWLRRPYEAWAACTRGLPSLHRAGARRDGPHLQSPHVRDHALLGRRSS